MAKLLPAYVFPFCLLTAATAQDDLATRLRDYLQRCERFGFAGSVLVAKDGKVVLAEGFGLANREQGVKNGKDTRFEIASTTKSFTAVAILQLEAAGKLATGDLIHTHLPGVPEAVRDLTIDHLLAHTSGMSRMSAGGFGDDLQRAVAGYFVTPRARAPGTHEYWNGGYALLAGIVERASGGSYLDWVRKEVFAKAGMTSSGFTGDALGDDVAIGYEGTEEPRRADEHPYESYGWHYRGMGGIVTTVEDLWRFDRALRTDALLDEAARSKLVTATSQYYGRGFFVIDKPRRKVGHGGDVRGFHTQFYSYPADDGCIVVLCNVGGIPLWAIEDSLQAITFGDPARCTAPPAASNWPAAQVAALGGVYERSPGEAITVDPRGADVVLQAAGVQSTALLTSSWFGKPTEPAPALLQTAQQIVQALAQGDVEPLRQQMNDNIPESWPGQVKSIYWPEHLQKWGALQSVRLHGALAEHGSTTVLLALDHEQRTSFVKIMFVGDRLQIFDLDGPKTLASCTAVPGKDQLLRFQWLGAQPEPIAVERSADGRVAALRIGDAVYNRRSGK